MADHPNLINLETGDEYEWVGPEGYAHVLDHDFAWPLDDLMRSDDRLVTVDNLTLAEVTALRERYSAAEVDQDEEPGVVHQAHPDLGFSDPELGW